MFQTISPCTDDQIFDPIEYLCSSEQTNRKCLKCGSHYVKRK